MNNFQHKYSLTITPDLAGGAFGVDYTPIAPGLTGAVLVLKYINLDCELIKRLSD